MLRSFYVPCAFVSRGLFALSTALLFAACGTPSNPACTSTAACASGQVCVSGACRSACTMDSTCTMGLVCRVVTADRMRACVTPDTPQACVLNSDCPMGQSCLAGLCRAECREDRDCTAGLRCEQMRCVMSNPDAGVDVPSGNDVPMGTDVPTGMDVPTGSDVPVTTDVPTGMDVPVTTDVPRVDVPVVPDVPRDVPPPTMNNIRFSATITRWATTNPVGEIAAGDVDGDGRLDVLAQRVDTAGTTTQGFSASRNTATRGVIDMASLAAPSMFMPMGCCNMSGALVDFDGNSRVDVMHVDPSTGGLLVQNMTTGTSISFATRLTFGTDMGYVGPFFISTLRSADLNGDMLPDLVAVNAGMFVSVCELIVMRNGTAGGVPRIASHSVISCGFGGAGSVRDMRLVDMDRDGRIDIVFAKGDLTSPDGVYLARNTSTAGTISFAAPARIVPMTETADSLQVADLNGDGNPDVAFTGQRMGVGTLVVSQNMGGGVFGPRVILNPAVGSPPRTLWADDFNNDTRVDLVVQVSDRAFHSYQNTHAVREALRFDGFDSAGGMFSVGEPIAGATFADIDGDAHPDLVYGFRNRTTAPNHGLAAVRNVSP